MELLTALIIREADLGSDFPIEAGEEDLGGFD